MKTKLIQIGNSQGVRIPKPLIEESGITGEVEMILRDNEIVLRSADTVRNGWEESFKKMAEKGDDDIIDKDEIGSLSDWDETEWEW